MEGLSLVTTVGLELGDVVGVNDGASHQIGIVLRNYSMLHSKYT